MARTHYPSYSPDLRIALLTPDLGIRQIRRKMRRARAVAATAIVLRRLAEAVETGTVTLPPVDAAVIVFTGICHGELTALERDLFWRVFQVPVFQQLLSPDGQVLAMECDAHDGLHLLDATAPVSGYRVLLDTEVCGCGNPHPRLSRLERLTALPAPPRVSPAVPAHVDENCDEENQQVHTARWVA
jgi:hypothetical protein